MSKSSLYIIIYIIGIIIGAIFLDIWGAETFLKAFIGTWFKQLLFLIALFYSEKKENN